MRTLALFDEDRTIWLWAGIALIVHVLAATALGLNPLKQLPRPEVVKGIAVEIIPPAPLPVIPPPNLEAMPEDMTPAERTEAAPPSTASSDNTGAQTRTARLETPDGMIPATQLYAAAILDNPKSRKAKMRLRQLVSEDRIIQLCNLEAMEQVHRWNPRFKPNFLVAYAKSDVRLTGRQAIEADGGAFHDGNSWFEIRFRCQTAPDMKSVIAFEFAVGSEIPRSKWEAYSLPERVESVD
ncbi:DUF930 domain-containing protein [uncultured Roseibium sp.]|uniref:DUF930 domain-containing protein n=1 Tax=uncultured Roseibium sp. TaxID=1936171 RepID=UPI0032164BAA